MRYGLAFGSCIFVLEQVWTLEIRPLQQDNKTASFFSFFNDKFIAAKLLKDTFLMLIFKTKDQFFRFTVQYFALAFL